MKETISYVSAVDQMENFTGAFVYLESLGDEELLNKTTKIQLRFESQMCQAIEFHILVYGKYIV